MKARFKNRSFNIVFTDHAIEQMHLRGVSKEEVVHVLERGKSKAKSIKNKYWVYLSLATRKDNSICVSISIEAPNLIVITTLVNWRPI